MSASWTDSTDFWLRTWALRIVARAYLEKDPVVSRLTTRKRVMRMVKEQNELELQRKASVV